MTPNTASTTAYRVLKGEYPPAMIDVSSLGISTYLNKETTARQGGSTLSEVKTIYPAAIELASTTHYQRGLVTVFAMLIIFGFFPLMLYGAYFLHGFLLIRSQFFFDGIGHVHIQCFFRYGFFSFWVIPAKSGYVFT